MKRIFVLSLVLALLLCGCRQPEESGAAGLDLWVTSQDRAEIYGALAEAWNRDNPQKPIQLNISVYSSRSIAGKFALGFSVSSSYQGSSIPDLVELDYGTFPEFVFQQTADLYPLQNMLDKHQGSVPGLSLYSKKDICFALPYHGQQLVLCYRLDLEDRFEDFRHQADSFESLMELGKQYVQDTGEPLLWVDYLGSELFLAMFLQALEGTEDPEEAYEAVTAWLEAALEEKVTGYLPSGDAYTETFVDLLTRQELPCFVTTSANLQQLAAQEESIGEHYGILALPGFGGIRRRVDAPTVAIAVHISGGDPVLARDFLEYCRFSEAAREYPAFYLGQDSTGIADLSESFRVLGSLQQPECSAALTASQLEPYLADYSQTVLGSALP